MAVVSEFRIRKCNDAAVNSRGDYVVYWMIANRRTHWNFSLQRAVEWSRRLNKPLVILEALRCGYSWASDRLHRFVIEGMQDNAARLENTGVWYYPYLEPASGEGQGLLRELGKQACVVVTDDFPAFFLLPGWSHRQLVGYRSSWRRWTPTDLCPYGGQTESSLPPIPSDDLSRTT